MHPRQEHRVIVHVLDDDVAHAQVESLGAKRQLSRVGLDQEWAAPSSAARIAPKESLRIREIQPDGTAPRQVERHGRTGRTTAEVQDPGPAEPEELLRQGQVKLPGEITR